MQRLLVILLFCSLSFYCFSQKPLKDLLPDKGSTINSFVPKGWLKLHTAFGDFDKDGLDDAAIVVIDSIYEKVTMEGNRSVVILKGTKKGFSLSSYCDSAFLCYSCGGVHGNPFESLAFNDGKLILKHIVGSSYRSELTTRFRYQKGEWVLIGETVKGSYITARCEKLRKFGGLSFYDINYLTGDYIYKEAEESNCELSKNKKGKAEKTDLIKLTDYNITSIWSIMK
jgi:hypothetical protein